MSIVWGELDNKVDVIKVYKLIPMHDAENTPWSGSCDGMGKIVMYMET